MNIKSKGSSITIDGRTFTGGSISITGNGKVIVDGVEQEGSLLGNVSVVVNGDCESIDAGTGEVSVTGSAGSVRSSTGDIRCGDVHGDVTTSTGDVTCGKVTGSVRTSTGDIYPCN